MTLLNTSYIGLRIDLLKYVEGKNLHILDVGCATGVNGLYLKNERIASLVVGIEQNEDMANIARKCLDDLILADLNTLNIDLALAGKEFDYIVFGDILEHLLDPWNTLSDFVFFLKKHGKIIISLPNIQHIETFIQLYFHSSWPTNERGLFDKTHLRYFTYKNILNLVDGSNLKICKIERNYRFRDNGSRFPRVIGKFLKSLFPNLFTFQYIVVCEKKTD